MTLSSDGGDLYVWGWNESGQLGLPSRGLRKALQQQQQQQSSSQTGKSSFLSNKNTIKRSLM